MNGLLRVGALALVASALSVPLAQAQLASKAGSEKASGQARMSQAYRNFVENAGQWDSRAKFLSRTQNMDVWVTNQGLVLDYYKQLGSPSSVKRDGQVVEMRFVGANKQSKAVGIQQGRLISQYLGPDKDFSKAKVARSYEEAKITSLYKGVDLRVYNDAGRPRYDVIVAPGANASQIALAFTGTRNLKVGSDGTLHIPTKFGRIEHQDLFAYQVIDGRKQQVKADFKLVNGTTVAFALGTYDRSKELVIDPVVYGSFYGGDSGMDEVRSVVADSDGGVFMTGSTRAPNFPIIAGPYGVVLSGASDAFITKFQGDAYSHDYAAIFGGSGDDTGKYIALDPTGNSVWIAGTTSSNNFPGLGAGSLKSTITGSTDIFLINFAKDSSQVLVPTYSTYFGSTSGAGGEELKGFAVGATSGNLYIGGQTGATGMPNAVNAFPGSSSAGYVTKLNPSGTSVLWTRYVGGTAPLAVGFFGMLPGGITGSATNATSAETGNGLAIDKDDNAALTGTLVFNGNQDTTLPGSTAFPTTPGVFPNGRLIRNNDIFVTKMDASGNLVFSAVLGGANPEFGSSIAADALGNFYVTGITTSFDYPRTRGTFGQDFSEIRVVLTKINQDGSSLVYSTGLNTHQGAASGAAVFPGGVAGVFPTGVAVDQRGFAFVTGIILDPVTFPNPPGDPNEPSQAATSRGTVPVTGDAPRPQYVYPTTPDAPTTDGWLMVMDETANNLVFGTYIGGLFDDYVFSPYTDRFGDVWVVGFTDLTRNYRRTSADGNTIHDYPTSTAGAGINQFITPLAFKNVGSGGAGTPPQTAVSYYGQLQMGPPFGPAPQTLATARGRDGYVIRFRIDVPVVQTITLNPAVIPGGLGATSVATISLNAPAPLTGSGVSVNVTLSSGAASFDPSGNQDSTIVTIPPGQTTGTVTIYSNEVQQASQVDVKAEYLGSFQVARLTVVPWLQRLTLSPGTVVGGNNAVGVVTLSAPAPAGGVDVTLLTNDASLVSFPSGGTLNIPAGQTTAPFTIVTNGVDAQTDVAISATLLNVGFTQTLTLRQASLQSVTFSPTRVAGGSQSTGTVRLDGKPGPSGFTVDLTLDNGTAGYVLNPTQLTFTSNDTQKTFTVTTAVETVNTQRRVTATRPAQGSYSAQSIQGTLFVDANNLVNMTLNPTSIASGGTSTGTITIAQTAQAGGVVVFLSSSNPAVASVPASVVIPAGSTTGTFTVTGQTVATNTNVNITASRGPTSVTRTLTVRGVTFTLSANPTSIIGGSGSITGTVTLAQAAPAGGVTVNLTSSNSSVVSVPATVTVPAGQTTATFPMNTSSVTTNQNVTITGQTQPGTTASVTVQIRAISLLNVFVNGNGVSTVFNVKGGSPAQYPKIRVQLDAPAPAGGATVTFTSTNSSVISVPPISIAAGQTMSADVTVPVARVNRTIAVTITANYNGRQIQRTINVFP